MVDKCSLLKRHFTANDMLYDHVQSLSPLNRRPPLPMRTVKSIYTHHSLPIPVTRFPRFIRYMRKRKAFCNVTPPSLRPCELLLLAIARGEVVESHAGSLVDFSRKTGADLALLEAKTPSSSELSASKRRRKAVKSHSRGRKRRGDDDDDNDDEANGSYVDESLSEPDDDPTSAEVNITDEFGRERTVLRGGAQHRAFLAAKKAKAEEKAEEKAKAEAYDERYSYRGNRGSTPLIPGVSTASGAIGDSGRPGEWTWGSGHGRGADCGDFETRKGEERRAAKGMAKLLQAEKSYASGGGGGGGRNGVDGEERGGKVCLRVEFWSVKFLAKGWVHVDKPSLVLRAEIGPAGAKCGSSIDARVTHWIPRVLALIMDF